MKFCYFSVLAFALLLGFSADAQAQRQKRAQTGMKFMSISPDAQASGMSDAVTAVEFNTAVAQFYNPAAMARMETMTSLAVGQINWIADIRYNYGALAFRPANGRFGVFGASILYVDYGDIDTYIFDRTDLGYLPTGTIRPWGLVAGIGYAKEITGQFSVGGNVKYVGQSLGSAVVSVDGGNYPRENYSTNVIAYDFGIMYKTGFESLTFAMTARNFSPEVTYIEEAFELPLTFKIGLAMDILDLTEVDQNQHNLMVSLEAERPRDYYEMLKIGTEYTFMKRFAVRVGYTFPTDEQGVSAGFGLKQPIRGGRNLGINYSFTEFGLFENVHRLSASISF